MDGVQARHSFPILDSVQWSSHIRGRFGGITESIHALHFYTLSTALAPDHSSWGNVIKQHIQTSENICDL